MVEANEEDGDVFDDAHGMITILLSALLVSGLWDKNKQKRRGSRGVTVQRQRRTVSSIMYELGRYCARFYRMDRVSFWKLHALLKPYIKKVSRKAACIDARKRKGGAPPNGKISSSVRLSVAIRYFAGGDPLDISLVHGISHSEVFRSVWFVVDAVHLCPELEIKFPTDHDRQRQIAKDFQDKNKANFGNCVGAIDGILIWINRPSRKDLKRMKIGAKKFFCGRKKKFGLNMQATCDAQRRFLDVSIQHPGATSDYLCFVTSPLYHLLEQIGFLAPGLALYGDNAYVSNRYMATPFKNVSSGPKDAYNYYQSSTRITIECAFGMLVHRWGMLRKPIPQGVSIAKTTSLVLCLCKLHNYCIDQKQTTVPLPTDQDSATISIGGGGGAQLEDIPDESSDSGDDSRPSGLLNGGDHFDDYGREIRRRDETRAATEQQESSLVLPRDVLLQIVIENDHRRKQPKGWNKK